MKGKEKTQEKLNVGASFAGIPVRHDTTVPLKSQRGITLIALVITIIVLLILAGVTLSIVFNGGIINKSQQAVDTYSEESAKEKLSLALFDYKMGYITGGEKDLVKYIDDNNVGVVTGGEEDSSTEYTVVVDGYEFIVKKENLEITSNGPATGESPSIVSIAKEPSTDNKSVTIKVIASAKNGGELIVKIGNQTATLEGGTYNLTVIKNGTYTVKVEENGLKRKAIRSISVTEIETTEIIANGNNINGTTNGTLTGLAYKYNNPVIPVGFKISSNGASWADANNDGIIDGWNDGLVITDAETNGNEFVWVPVHNQAVVENGITIPAVPYEKWTSSTNGTPTASNTSDDSLPSGVTSENTQIITYGGFYIARYEAGIPTDDSNLTAGLEIASADARNKSGVPVSKKNQIPWNYIDYTISKANAERMYEIKNSKNEVLVKSGLVTGRQWDTTMKWLENASVNVQTDSRGWGNYKNAPVSGITEFSTDYGASWTTVTSQTKGTSTSWLLKTGHTDYTRRKNIYDLAGNIWEWTNEMYSSDPVYRGGRYGNSSTEIPAAYRWSYSVSYTDYLLGFRCVLYVI